MSYSRKKIAEELVGASEAAELLGIKTSTITAYVARRQIVAPIVTLACGPVWLREDILRWHNQRPGQTRPDA